MEQNKLKSIDKEYEIKTGDGLSEVSIFGGEEFSATSETDQEFYRVLANPAVVNLDSKNVISDLIADVTKKNPFQKGLPLPSKTSKRGVGLYPPKIDGNKLPNWSEGRLPFDISTKKEELEIEEKKEKDEEVIEEEEEEKEEKISPMIQIERKDKKKTQSHESKISGMDYIRNAIKSAEKPTKSILNKKIAEPKKTSLFASISKIGEEKIEENSKNSQFSKDSFQSLSSKSYSQSTFSRRVDKYSQQSKLPKASEIINKTPSNKKLDNKSEYNSPKKDTTNLVDLSEIEIEQNYAKPNSERKGLSDIEIEKQYRLWSELLKLSKEKNLQIPKHINQFSKIETLDYYLDLYREEFYMSAANQMVKTNIDKIVGFGRLAGPFIPFMNITAFTQEIEQVINTYPVIINQIAKNLVPTYSSGSNVVPWKLIFASIFVAFILSIRYDKIIPKLFGKNLSGFLNNPMKAGDPTHQKRKIEQEQPIPPNTKQTPTQPPHENKPQTPAHNPQASTYEHNPTPSPFHQQKQQKQTPSPKVNDQEPVPSLVHSSVSTPSVTPNPIYNQNFMPTPPPSKEIIGGVFQDNTDNANPTPLPSNERKKKRIIASSTSADQ